MATICCAWELGGGLGHVSSLAEIGRQFKNNGHDVVYILKNPEKLSYFANSDSRKFEAPRSRFHYKGEFFPIINYAEILLHQGYFSTEILFNLCRRWRNLLIANDVDFLVVDHSPTAMLAAYSLNIDCISIGTGFSSPKRISPFPVFREGYEKCRERIKASENETLATINIVLKQLQTPQIDSVADLFNTLKLDILTTYRELDVYMGRSTGEYVGPVISVPTRGFDNPSWPDVFESNVFVYIKKDYRYLRKVLRQIANIQVNFLIYIDDARLLKSFSRDHKHVQLTDKPLGIAKVLQNADAVLCHAGHGLVIETLSHGIPLIMLPMVQEQALTAACVEKLKAGISFTPEQASINIADVINTLLNDVSCRANAEKFASGYQGYNGDAKLTRRIRECTERFLSLIHI